MFTNNKRRGRVLYNQKWFSNLDSVLNNRAFATAYLKGLGLENKHFHKWWRTQNYLRYAVLRRYKRLLFILKYKTLKRFVVHKGAKG